MWRLAIAILLLGIASLGLGFGFSQANQARTFITAPVERGVVASTVNATGTLEAQKTVDVSSQLSGQIAKVLVDFNDVVKAGQPLAQLDQESFVARVNEERAALKMAIATGNLQQATVERSKLSVANTRSDKSLAEALAASAQAKQKEAERELERKTKLARTGSGSERDLSQALAARDMGAADLRAILEQVEMKAHAIEIAEADVRIAEADLENAEAVIEQKQAALDQAELDFKRTVLRSPIDGVIIGRYVDPGQTIAVTLDARTLFRIANNLDSMEVHGRIDEADIGKLKVGQTARFTVDAYPDRTFSGRVLQIRKASEVVQNVVTYTAIVSAANPEHLLLPNMTAELRIIVGDTGETLKIPNQALRFRPDATDEADGKQAQDASALTRKTSATVWVAGNDGRPKPISVQVGLSDDNNTQVLEGPLTEGQPLIVAVSNTQAPSRFLGIRMGF
jgi:HlyD family secretion protein